MSTIKSISLLPLPTDKLEEMYQLRAERKADTSVMLFSQLPFATKKRGSMNQAPTMSPTCRTGRWSIEESAFAENLMRSFDAGLLPLPQGIKLNVSNLKEDLFDQVPTTLA